MGAFAAALALAALTAGLPRPAAAQAAAACTAIADDGERLACYDRALRAAHAPAASTPAAAPAAQAPVAPAAQTPAAPAAPTHDPALVPAAAAPSGATATAAAAPAATREDDDEIVAIVVVGVRSLPGRETTFTTQDGASWVQTDSQRVVGLPDAPFEAELKPGVMGSKFLVPVGRGRAIRVRAVEP